MQTRVKFAALSRRWSRLKVISHGDNPRPTASGRHCRARRLAITFGLVWRTWRSLRIPSLSSLYAKSNVPVSNKLNLLVAALSIIRYYTGILWSGSVFFKIWIQKIIFYLLYFWVFYNIKRPVSGSMPSTKQIFVKERLSSFIIFRNFASDSIFGHTFIV